MSKQFLSELGARIRAAREAKGLSQEDVANEAGLERAAYYRRTGVRPLKTGLERAYSGRVQRGEANISVTNTAVTTTKLSDFSRKHGGCPAPIRPELFVLTKSRPHCILRTEDTMNNTSGNVLLAPWHLLLRIQAGVEDLILSGA
jgi:hypothetical protein